MNCNKIEITLLTIWLLAVTTPSWATKTTEGTPGAGQNESCEEVFEDPLEKVKGNINESVQQIAVAITDLGTLTLRTSIERRAAGRQSLTISREMSKLNNVTSDDVEYLLEVMSSLDARALGKNLVVMLSSLGNLAKSFNLTFVHEKVRVSIADAYWECGHHLKALELVYLSLKDMLCSYNYEEGLFFIELALKEVANGSSQTPELLTLINKLARVIMSAKNQDSSEIYLADNTLAPSNLGSNLTSSFLRVIKLSRTINETNDLSKRLFEFVTPMIRPRIDRVQFLSSLLQNEESREQYENLLRTLIEIDDKDELTRAVGHVIKDLIEFQQVSRLENFLSFRFVKSKVLKKALRHAWFMPAASLYVKLVDGVELETVWREVKGFIDLEQEHSDEFWRSISLDVPSTFAAPRIQAYLYLIQILAQVMASNEDQQIFAKGWSYLDQMIPSGKKMITRMMHVQKPDQVYSLLDDDYERIVQNGPTWISNAEKLLDQHKHKKSQSSISSTVNMPIK